MLAADTVGWLDGKVIGKPEDEADARRIIRSLAGTVHELVDGRVPVACGRVTGNSVAGAKPGAG